MTEDQNKKKEKDRDRLAMKLGFGHQIPCLYHVHIFFDKPSELFQHRRPRTFVGSLGSELSCTASLFEIG